MDYDMLKNQSTEKVVDYLYLAEAYYFNPKQIKRKQVYKLIALMQQNLGTDRSCSPKRIETGNNINI